MRCSAFRISTLVTVVSLAIASSAFATNVTANKADVTFHISHPAKEYDANLLPGGAKIIGTFVPEDLSKTGFDVSIQVDQFNSDNSRRDSHMIETMEALIFPTITWKVTKIDGAAGPVAVGTHKGFASGPLTVHGVTKNLDAPITMTIKEDGTVTVTSEFSISLENFGIERPTLVFVPIEDDLPIKVQVVFPGGSGIFPPEAAPAPEASPTEEASSTPPAGQ